MAPLQFDDWPFLNCAMYDQCKSIDRLLFKYRQTRESIDDQLALILLVEVIADLEAEKIALHPERKGNE